MRRLMLWSIAWEFWPATLPRSRHRCWCMGMALCDVLLYSCSRCMRQDCLTHWTRTPCKRWALTISVVLWVSVWLQLISEWTLSVWLVSIPHTQIASRNFMIIFSFYRYRHGNAKGRYATFSVHVPVVRLCSTDGVILCPSEWSRHQWRQID